MASTAKNKRAPAHSKAAAYSSNGSVELLAYYKQRIGEALLAVVSRVYCLYPATTPNLDLQADEFEAERQNLLERVDTCAAQKAEQHKLEWESKRRAEEVKELQKVTLQPKLAIQSCKICPRS